VDGNDHILRDPRNILHFLDERLDELYPGNYEAHKGKGMLYHILGLKAHVRTNIQSEAGKKASSDGSTVRRDQVMNTLCQRDWFVTKEDGKNIRIERGFKGCVEHPL
jgi:hypothetical protein